MNEAARPGIAARLATLAVVVGLVAAPAAQAGGFATIGVSSTPDGLAAGETWVVELEVLAHGRSPVDLNPAFRPRLVLTERATGTRHRVRAAPTGEPGTYRARFTFPAAGEWEYAIRGYDGRRTYPPVTIVGLGEAGSPAIAGSAGKKTAAPALGALGAGLLTTVLVALGLGRHRRLYTGPPDPARRG